LSAAARCRSCRSHGRRARRRAPGSCPRHGGANRGDEEGIDSATACGWTTCAQTSSSLWRRRAFPSAAAWCPSAWAAAWPWRALPRTNSALMPIVRSLPAFLTSGESSQTQHTKLTLTLVTRSDLCSARASCFSGCFSPFIQLITGKEERPVDLLASRMNVSIPTPALMHPVRALPGRARAILATPTYAHGSHRSVLVRMQSKKNGKN
jgi:hypothetical protein